MRLREGRRSCRIDDTVAKHVDPAHWLRGAQYRRLRGRRGRSVCAQQRRNATDEGSCHGGAVELAGTVGSVRKQRGRIRGSRRPDSNAGRGDLSRAPQFVNDAGC
jgi:hypothetical protein